KRARRRARGSSPFSAQSPDAPDGQPHGRGCRRSDSSFTPDTKRKFQQLGGVLQLFRKLALAFVTRLSAGSQLEQAVDLHLGAEDLGSRVPERSRLVAMSLLANAGEDASPQAGLLEVDSEPVGEILEAGSS